MLQHGWLQKLGATSVTDHLWGENWVSGGPTLCVNLIYPF